MYIGGAQTMKFNSKNQIKSFLAILVIIGNIFFLSGLIKSKNMILLLFIILIILNSVIAIYYYKEKNYLIAIFLTIVIIFLALSLMF